MVRPPVQIKLLSHYYERFKKIDAFQDGIPQLKRATKGSSGYDLLACIDDTIELYPGDQKFIQTGIAVFIEDENFEAQIRPRSGKGSRGLVLGNTIGTIDADYQGEIIICAWNRNNETRIKIFPGEAIAQLVFCPVVHPRFNLVKEFTNISTRNEGGFGHTDVYYPK